MSSIQVTTRVLTKDTLTFGELDEGEFFTIVSEPGIWYIKASLSSRSNPIAVRLNSGHGTIIDDEGLKVKRLSSHLVIEITNNKGG